MTANELTAFVGREGTVVFSGMRIAVVVTDAKMAYGQARLEVMPKAGEGRTWIDLSRVLGVRV